MDFKFCAKCGDRNPFDATFCSQCGAPQVVLTRSTALPGQIPNSDVQPVYETRPQQAYLWSVSQPYRSPYTTEHRRAYSQQTFTPPQASGQVPRNNKQYSVKHYVSKFAGEQEDAVKDIKLSSLFSAVFAKPTHVQAEELFISGTSRTTPDLVSVNTDDNFLKPWLFSRLLVWFAVYALASMKLTGALFAIIVISAIAVPMTGVVFFFETNVLRNISFLRVIQMVTIGGIFSVLATGFLIRFELGTGFTLINALSMGVVEELAKGVVVCYYVNKLRTGNVLNGLLIGGSVGAGFASIATMGYISQSNDPIAIAFERAWSALGSHLIWAALIGAGLVLAVRTVGKFSAACMGKSQFLAFFVCAILLHVCWDWRIPINDNYKVGALVIVGCAMILSLISIGVREITQGKSAVSNAAGTFGAGTFDTSGAVQVPTVGPGSSSASVPV